MIIKLSKLRNKKCNSVAKKVSNEALKRSILFCEKGECIRSVGVENSAGSCDENFHMKKNANFHKNHDHSRKCRMCLILSSWVCYAAVPGQPTPETVSQQNFCRYPFSFLIVELRVCKWCFRVKFINIFEIFFCFQNKRKCFRSANTKKKNNCVDNGRENLL